MFLFISASNSEVVLCYFLISDCRILTLKLNPVANQFTNFQLSLLMNDVNHFSDCFSASASGTAVENLRVFPQSTSVVVLTWNFTAGFVYSFTSQPFHSWTVHMAQLQTP